MTKGLNSQIAHEAAEWAVLVDAGPLSPAERRDLADWLNASPIHIEEFMIASALLTGAGHAASVARADLTELLAAGSAEIVELPQERPSTRSTSDAQTPSPTRMRSVWAALAAVFVFGVFLIFSDSFERFGAPEPAIHITGLGEQRTLSLEDGTLIHLNTQSEIHVAYSESERRVELLKGEALFDIESDTDRPFIVTAGDTVAEALGTIFNVRKLHDAAVVSVVEGKVRVDQRDAEKGYRVQHLATGEASRTILLSAQEPVVLTGGKTASVDSHQRIVDLGEEERETMTSWRDRKIVFERRSLSWVVAEFNRYNRSRLVIADEGLLDERFSGTFNADDPASFVMFLEQHHDMRSIKVGRDTHIRRK